VLQVRCDNESCKESHIDSLGLLDFADRLEDSVLGNILERTHVTEVLSQMNFLGASENVVLSYTSYLQLP